MSVRTADTPLTADEQIDQSNLTAKVCDNARKRLAGQTAEVPERYRGKVVMGLNEVPRYLNEQAQQGYKYLSVLLDNGYIYVLVEKAHWRFGVPQDEVDASDRPARWEY